MRANFGLVQLHLFADTNVKITVFEAIDFCPVQKRQKSHHLRKINLWPPKLLLWKNAKHLQKLAAINVTVILKKLILIIKSSLSLYVITYFVFLFILSILYKFNCNILFLKMIKLYKLHYLYVYINIYIYIYNIQNSI